MSARWMYDNDDALSLYQAAMGNAPRPGAPGRRFDEYYRCYPVAMMPGPEREHANHGGKVFLPASALEKLTRLHIAYPMLFELINGAKDKQTHAGVLEFIAEEGKIYLPYWLMQTLQLEAGDLLQIKSTDLPPGSFIKLQPQSPSFLEISDPKAVLENAFRNFSCLTQGDVFSFAYNDNVYEIAVLEVKPDTSKHAICTMETDLSVDFATPVGYEEPRKASIASSTGTDLPTGGTIQPQGTMAKAINYASIAPSSTEAAKGANAVASHFLGEGHRLATKRSSKNTTPRGSSTPVAGTSMNDMPGVSIPRRANGPQPLRLPPNKLFFGFEYKPPKKKAGEKEDPGDNISKPHFQGMGQTLRGKKIEPTATTSDSSQGEKAERFGGEGQKLGKSKR